LEIKFRPDIFRDFQEMTFSDYTEGHLYGLEKVISKSFFFYHQTKMLSVQFWAFLYYRPEKEKNRVDVITDLKKALLKFKGLDDFKVVWSTKLHQQQLQELQKQKEQEQIEAKEAAVAANTAVATVIDFLIYCEHSFIFAVD